MDTAFCKNRYRPSQPREIPKLSATRSARIGMTIWHTYENAFWNNIAKVAMARIQRQPSPDIPPLRDEGAPDIEFTVLLPRAGKTHSIGEREESVVNSRDKSNRAKWAEYPGFG